MTTIAIYSSKGGVGKTSLAVNLAWAAATASGRRTLLWDLDAQAAASFILMGDVARKHRASDVIERETAPEKLIEPTGIRNLDLLPADASLRNLDLLFAEIGAKKRLQRIADALGKNYDRILIDCPPGLGLTAQQIIRGAALIVVPMIPSTLSTRAAEELRAHLDSQRKAGPAIMPVFNMVDRRRAAHRSSLEACPDQPAIPAASLIEQMADRHAALGAYAPRSDAAISISRIWTAIERRLANG